MTGFGERNKQDETRNKNTAHVTVPEATPTTDSVLSETYTYRTHNGLLPKEHQTNRDVGQGIT